MCFFSTNNQINPYSLLLSFYQSLRFMLGRLCLAWGPVLTTPVCCFVSLHHWEELLAQNRATKHAQGWSSMETELGHFSRNGEDKLCIPAAQSSPSESAQQTCCKATQKSCVCSLKLPERRVNSMCGALSVDVLSHSAVLRLNSLTTARFMRRTG